MNEIMTMTVGVSTLLGTVIGAWLVFGIEAMWKGDPRPLSHAMWITVMMAGSVYAANFF